MKYMAISDIHGSSLALQTALKFYEIEKPDKLIILGDILYHGPRNDLPNGYAPKEVVKILNEMKDKLVCVRGNCDAEVDEFVLEFPIGAMYAILESNGKKIFLTHGHKLATDLKKYVSSFDVVLSGHTHLSGIEKIDGVWFVNPGSISIPKNGTNPAYAIIENGKATLKTLSGEAFAECDFND